MKSIKRIRGFAFCVALLCAMPLVISADTGYSTQDDPLITLSYIQKVLKPALKEEILDELSVDDLTADLKKQLKSELEKDLKASLTASLEAELTKSLTASLTKSITAQMQKELSETLQKDLESELLPKLEQELTDRLKGELLESITEEVRASVVASLTEELREQIREEMSPKLEDMLSDVLKEELLGSDYKTVVLTKGQTLQLTRSAEVVMVSGLAKAVFAEDAAAGLYDLTAGRRILPDQEVLQSHCLVISSGGGCGIYVTHTEATFMIRGEYSIAEHNE